MMLWFLLTLILIVFYAYLGYGLILYLMVRVKRLFVRKKKFLDFNVPSVTLVVPAYNEADWIEDKIKNSLALNYPKEKLSILFVTDGSNDATPEIVKQYEQVELEHRPERLGKIAAVNRIMPGIKSEITIFTDANTLLNKDALLYMVRHFDDIKVGAVAGEKRIREANTQDASAAGEGIYWKYESTLKDWDSELYSAIGAAGELFAIRTSLYETVKQNTLIEDFVLTMGIARKGYKIAYEKNAYALETASQNILEEVKRKIRISAGGLQAIWILRSLLLPFKNPLLSFQYVSHRVLRWTLAPIALILIFILSSVLAWQGNIFGQVLTVLQIIFYAMAALGYYFERKAIKFKILFVPLYFTMMNVCVYLGWWRLMHNNQSVVWDKAERKK